MRRRQFIVGLWGAFGWASMTLAQGSGKLPIVGFLNSASAEGYGIMAAAFKAGLADSGYVEPDNVIVEYRWANDDYTRLPALAADLVSRRVDVIFANSPSITSAQAATKTIPIVFLSGDDPVRLGVVTSLNKPEGNTTGVAILSRELADKRLGLLHELVPESKKIAVLVNSDFGPSRRFQADVEAGAVALGLTINLLHANTDTEMIRNPRSIVCGRLVGRTWPLPGQPAQAARRPCHADPHPRRVRDPRNRRCWRPYELWGECGGGVSPSRNIRRPYPQG